MQRREDTHPNKAFWFLLTLLITSPYFLMPFFFHFWYLNYHCAAPTLFVLICYSDAKTTGDNVSSLEQSCRIGEEDLHVEVIEKCIFDLMPWFPHPRVKSCGCGGIQFRTRFVMISLCIFNAHRTVLMSRPSGAVVVVNHAENVGRLKKLPFPHLYNVIRMNRARI